MNCQSVWANPEKKLRYYNSDGEGRSQSSSWVLYGWMATTVTSIPPQVLFNNAFSGNMERLGETERPHIHSTVWGMFASAMASCTHGLKFSRCQLTEGAEGRERSGVWLPICRCLFFFSCFFSLRCHSSVRDVICSASNLFTSLKMLSFLSLDRRQQMSSSKRPMWNVKYLTFFITSSSSYTN